MANTKIPSELVAINAISGTLIADNAITSVHIAENNITAVQIAINAVTALQMADGTITSAKIADGTIVTADIADGQITTGKLADSSVTTGKIAAGTIASSDIANNAILTQHIDDNQITADQIADNAVGVDQLAGITRGSVLTGNAAGNPSLLALGAANTLLQSDGTDLVFAPLQSGIDDNSNAVAITIDSSENVLIGATAETNWETVAGFRARPSGSTTITRASAPALYVNRITNDGGLVEFRRGTTVVGSIGYGGGGIMFNAASQYGLKFYDASSINIIHPATTAGGDKDASVSLGYSGSRFKDLHLSGNIAVGGTVDGVDIQTLNTTAGAALPKAGGTLTGDLLVDSSNAEINLKSGVAGTSGAINWTYNTTTTNYASIKLPYDTRASTGLHIDAGYPITIDSASNTGIKFVVGSAAIGRFTNTALYVGTGNQVQILQSGSSLFPSLKVNNNGYIGSASVTDALQFQTSGALHAKTTLKIGTDPGGDAFNTTSPLMIGSNTNAYINIKAGTNHAGGLLIGDSDDDFVGGFIYSNDTNDLDLFSNNQERMSIKSTGQIHIGHNTIGGSTGTSGVILSDGGKNGSLGTTLGDTQRVVQLHNLSQNQDYLTFRTRRITDGQSGWNHAVWDITRDIDNTSDLYRYITFGIGELAINDFQTNLDFRVESDTHAHALFVDAGNSRVGINTSTPSNALQVNSLTQSDIVRFENNNGGFVLGKTGNLGSMDLAADAAFRFRHGSVESLRLKHTESVFNENGANVDFRVESDDSDYMLQIDAGRNDVNIGATGGYISSHLAIQSKFDRHHFSMTSSPNSAISATGGAMYAEGVVSISTTSAGTVLTIPHFSQPNLWRPTYVELMFVSGEYNRTIGLGGYAKVSYSMLTYLNGLSTLDVGGNVASVTASGTNLLVNFSTGYVSGLSNNEGVQMHYKIMSRTPDYFQAWNATLN